MKKYFMLSASALLALTLAACGDTKEAAEPQTTTEENTASENTTEAATQTIEYLGENYELTADVKNIIAGSYEALEDLVAMSIQPVGVFDMVDVPDYVKNAVANAGSIGDIIAPSAEATVSLAPDVILGTMRWQPETIEQLEKVQTIIPYSQSPKDWQANLQLLGKLSGKEQEAQKLIDDYAKKVETMQVTAKKELADTTILMTRYRKNLMIYPEDVYFNPVLYSDLGAPVPQVVKDAPQQIELSLEKLAELNPDILLLQVPVGDADAVVAELKKDPIFQGLNAVKNDNFVVNIIDPAAIGGTVLSKNLFLDAFSDKFLQ